MMYEPAETLTCPTCGFEFPETHGACPLCAGEWEAWELMFSPLPLPEIRAQIAGWVGQLPFPVILEIAVNTDGAKIRMYGQPDTLQNAASVWAAMTHQQTRWQRVDHHLVSNGVWVASTSELLPTLSPAVQGDPFLAITGNLMDIAQKTAQEAALRLWLLGKDGKLQERLRELYAYAYSSEAGVSDDTPNPWGVKLTILKMVLFLGMGSAACGSASAMIGWIPGMAGIITLVAGTILTVVAGVGTYRWMKWRSVPKDVVQARLQDAVVQTVCTVYSPVPPTFSVFAGKSNWEYAAGWPEIKRFSVPLPAGEIAGIVAPPERGEGSGIIHRDVWQDTISPPPSPALVTAPFRVGYSVATGDPVGIDPDGHGVMVGGTRTGKSSAAWQMLNQLIQRGDDAPGIFLVDPHLSLADAFLAAVDRLPPEQRAKAVKRLRVITPDHPEIVPLNLLAVPEYSWAGNALIQFGTRIWKDYWGPRMQAALLALFRLAHAWNMEHPDQAMGLLHVIFAAFNPEWRMQAMALLPPVDRMGGLALDALLGQTGNSDGGWQQKWATEVVSPIISKTMSLELSNWLFASMHHSRFVDFERWIDERAWIVMRLPSGMGIESSRMVASVVYNVFDAAYRKKTMLQPVPYYFVIDETQEIGGGMQLESMLSEGAKFGARMFILTQSLSMLRRVEGFEALVQAILANTSTQMFFSPDPEDADLIRATLNASARYGQLTLDLPTLHCWLRARIEKRWQPPSVIRVDYPPQADQKKIHDLIREVIKAHPDDYAPQTDWQGIAVDTLVRMVLEQQQWVLSLIFDGKPMPPGKRSARKKNSPDRAGMDRRLGL